jgi:hypothetical protein
MSEINTESLNNFIVRPLTVENRNDFLNYMDEQFKNSKCLRNDWFDRSLKWCLQNRYENYLYWSIVYKDNQIVAFSAVQEYPFRENTVRVCSRMYYDPSIRYDYNKSNYKNVITPVTPMMTDQFLFLKNKNYKYAIATVESTRSLKTLNIVANNVNSKTKLTNFKVMNDKIQTYAGQPESEFQFYMEHQFF